AENRADENTPVDAVHGARIEVFNNTTNKPELEIANHPTPTFAVQFEQGNHYTIMLRKEGYFTKRMEAYVNVKGCILCFDGVGEVTPGKPGVSDVLTERNSMGTLLANVGMMPIKMNKSIVIENIYYDVNKYRLKSKVRAELDKLAIILIDNPELLVEIGSHTDATGDDKYNLRLSRKRARKVVEYLVEQGVNKNRIVAKGYGESKLTNGCKNGVDCSDRKHAKNRRTELKVIGYVHETVGSDKSLVEIKEEEAFERMLQEIQNQDVVEIKEGEELPDEIKKQLYGAGSEQESTQEEVLDEQKEKTVVELVETKAEETINEETSQPSEAQKKMEGNKEKVDINSEPPTNTITPVETEEEPEAMAKMEKESKAKLGGSTVYARPNKTEKAVIEPESVQNTELDDKVSTVVASPNNIMKEEENEASEAFDAAYMQTENTETVFGEVEVNTNRAALMREAHLLASEYTGYMVQFYTSPVELPSSHEIFSKHGNITVEQRKDGVFAYLLGDFKNEKDAKMFLDTIMSKRYPGARVIQFRRGNRMN
ncbi:MAG: OmpA family protein, partial [Bacteroidota bacterium]